MSFVSFGDGGAGLDERPQHPNLAAKLQIISENQGCLRQEIFQSHFLIWVVQRLFLPRFRFFGAEHERLSNFTSLRMLEIQQ